LGGAAYAYYLIHSMMGGVDFHEKDVLAARNFARAAHEAGVQRLIYLGGLGDEQVSFQSTCAPGRRLVQHCAKRRPGDRVSRRGDRWLWKPVI